MSGPTPERLKRGTVELPKRDQITHRRAALALDIFDAAARSRRIDAEQYRVAVKLRRHYCGALGIRVGDGTGTKDGPEFARTYHDQQMQRARKSMRPTQWLCLDLVLADQLPMIAIGQLLCRYSGEKQAQAAGYALMAGALDALVLLWPDEG